MKKHIKDIVINLLVLLAIYPVVTIAQTVQPVGTRGGGGVSFDSGSSVSSCDASAVIYSNTSKIATCLAAELSYDAADNELAIGGTAGVELFYNNTNIAGIRAGTTQNYMKIGGGAGGTVFGNQSLSTFWGIYTSTGLRIGDATNPTAALEVTNLAVAKPIARFYDNTDLVAEIADTGMLWLQPTATATVGNPVIQGYVSDSTNWPWSIYGEFATTNSVIIRIGGNGGYFYQASAQNETVISHLRGPSSAATTVGSEIELQSGVINLSFGTAGGYVTPVIVPATGGIQITTGTKPTCDSASRGKIYYVAGGAGVVDTFEVCTKDVADSYAWATIF